ncbi:ATP-binding protein [Streptomyces uncialis]|uniref:ATP-binding protein n=1 Tax=Streptomyces uncialis TaxID=1048205 RepID=UPI002252FA77|nr:ATP-binding protein [Streptomyces uncialis]MCX4658020.1 ATP-binding protein [Streptomyces uncialis]
MTSPAASRPAGIRHTRIHLDRCARACGEARRWARNTLRDWPPPDGCPHGRADEDIVLVVSELVTNAVTHAVGPIRADLHRHPDGSIRVAVTDGGPAAFTHRPAAGPLAEHGRGLAIVAALAARHGRDTTPARPFRARSWAVLTPTR